MAGECVIQGPDIKELEEEGLWELINDHRHRISLGVRPCIVLPYLRQARVLTELDEDEIFSCHTLKNRLMRCSESPASRIQILLWFNVLLSHVEYVTC